MNVEFVNRSGLKLPQSLLRRWLKVCVARLPSKDRRRIGKKTVLIVFVSKAEMKSLNRQFRGKNYPTDVLSFESIEPSSLGELVISPLVVRTQAQGTGLTYHQELCYMVLHGVLHLLGYDHETSEKDSKIMLGLQDKVFQSLATRFKFR